MHEVRPFQLQFAVNTAYYLGFQHLNYSPIDGTILRDIDNEELIINRIAPFVELRVAKLTRAKPILTVVPSKKERDKIQGAELSEMLVKYLWKCQDMDQKLRYLALLLNIYGSVFIKTLWNPSKGEKVKNKIEDGHLRLDDDGEEEYEEFITGEIETHIKSPFSIFASPGAHTLKEADWIIDKSTMTVRQLQETYPHVDIDEIKLSEETTEYERFVNRLQSPIFSVYSGYTTSRKERIQKVKDHQLVTVKEFWLKPNEVYPKGVVATVVGDKLIDFQEFPNQFYEYPFIKIDEKEQPFSFYGGATVSRLIPLQRRYNEARTQISKNAAMFASVKWWVPKGSGLHQDSLSDESGEIVETNANLPRPQQMEVMPMPQYVMDSQMQDLKDIREISGEREASEVAGLPQVTASVALETVAELSEAILGPVIKNVESGLIELGRQWLILANENYDDPRTLKIVGPNNEYMIKDFDKEDLKHQTDVTIQLESFLGMSKQAQQQKILDMWDRRVITDPNSFLDAFISGDVEKLRRAQASFEKVIAEDVQAIKDGKMPPILPADNHILYIARLSEFIQSPEFRRLPPDRQQIAMGVLQQHIGFVQPMQQEGTNPAAVGTPVGPQVPEGAV